MKYLILKSAIIGTLAIFMVTSISAQTKGVTKTKAQTTQTKSVAKTKAIEKSNLPIKVTEEFVREYPMVDYDMWYGYPTIKNGIEWYDYNPMYYTNKEPEYYLVEFSIGNKVQKTVYNKDGKIVALHNKVQTETVPAAVNTALKNSNYKTWKETEAKEEIKNVKTKDNVYKITVEKDGKKHYLFYDSKGKLLKDRE